MKTIWQLKTNHKYYESTDLSELKAFASFFGMGDNIYPVGGSVRDIKIQRV